MWRLSGNGIFAIMALANLRLGDLLFDIEPDDVIAFGEQSFGPSAEAAEKINGERFAQNANSSVAC